MTWPVASFGPPRPTSCGIADFTYLRTWEDWLYLAAVQNACSRRIVGWCIAAHMRQERVIEALTMAVSRRRPDPGLIQHSDQGSQPASPVFGQLYAKSGISQSMGSTGVCWDNAVAETFFATLKKELVYRRSWPTRHKLTSEICEYIEAFYNRQRRHFPSGCSPRFTSKKDLAARQCRTLAHTINYRLNPQALNCPENRGNSSKSASAAVARATGPHIGGRGASALLSRQRVYLASGRLRRRRVGKQEPPQHRRRGAGSSERKRTD
jgi:hypothetical protein